MAATREELIAAVRKHALENYNKDGWDYVVECFSDDEIMEDVKDATTAAEAIARVEWHVKLLDERRREVQNEIF